MGKHKTDADTLLAAEFKRISNSSILNAKFSNNYKEELSKYTNFSQIQALKDLVISYGKNWLLDEILNTNISILADDLLEMIVVHDFNAPERAAITHFIGSVLY